ncbi:MAG: hypothetical protein M5U01_41120 [Ardenticatenaceae bacterium]|nr:hypothetical protein [Ardenticatenaceae bacterium]
MNCTPTGRPVAVVPARHALQRLVQCPGHRWVVVLVEVRARQAQAYSLPARGFNRGVGRNRLIGGIRVALVGAGDDAQNQAGILDRAGDRPDDVEGRREGDQPAPPDAPERRLEPNAAAERGRDANRSAGVGPESAGAEAGNHCCGRASASADAEPGGARRLKPRLGACGRASASADAERSPAVETAAGGLRPGVGLRRRGARPSADAEPGG